MEVEKSRRATSQQKEPIVPAQFYRAGHNGGTTSIFSIWTGLTFHAKVGKNKVQRERKEISKHALLYC